ncbi:tetratricopeptide repeat protein [uncultured Aquimarina sp.]|uniref:tetratricopeptide repeat protein n=1 Tax=uncultured Aquimarina sp. TaxID=575652 RepID=UPI002618119E|nr:tetratricopeptide repeat protein [uncultured Aquimarina sp.]
MVKCIKDVQVLIRINYIFVLSISFFFICCKNNNRDNEILIVSDPKDIQSKTIEHFENEYDYSKVPKDSLVYKITKKCFKDKFVIGLNFSKRAIVIKKNNTSFEIPAVKLIEEASDKEMVSDFNIICNCIPEGLSINYEFDLFLYQYKSIQHRVIFDDDNVYLTKAFNFYSNRQQETLFGSAYKRKTSYSYDELVDLESDTTQLIQFKNFQDENYEQNIDAYFSEIQELYSDSKFDKLKLIADITVLELALKNVQITDALAKYNNIAYYLEQAKVYEEAVFLLEKIVQNAPNRTVAYINLGDVYWGLDEKEKAKEAYKIYIEQMKTNSKASKIPKRVIERLQ